MRCLGLVLVFLGITPILCGQKPDFEHLTDQDGLSNSNVTSILKDSEGYMWFSTFNGLSRYDGYQFTNFLHNPEDSQSVCSNRIWGLMETQDKVLFITSPFDGFSTYDKRTETFKSYHHQSNDPSGLSANMVLSIWEDKRGSVWLGTTAGLDKFDHKTGTFQHFYPFGKHLLNYISGITEDKEGNLWLYGQSNQLCKFNPEKNTYEYLKFSDNPQASEVFNHWGLVFCDSKSNLWVGNRLEGLQKISPDGKRQRYSTENKKLGSNVLMSIKEDSEGHIWVCTDGGGLFEYYPETNSFRDFQHDPEDASSLGSNAVYCLYESEPGLIWVGTYAAGLSILKKEKRKFLKFDARGTQGKRLSQKSVLAVEEADNGKIWMATDGGGLHLYDPARFEFKNYTEQNGKTAANVITCMMKDKAGDLWCGTYRKGFFKLKAGTEKLERFSTEITKGLSSNNVFSFCETDDKIWIGYVARGIDLYDKRTATFTRSTLDTIDKGDFAKSSVFKIYKDSKSRVWIGTENSGTVCYDPVNNKVYHFTYELNNQHTIGSNDIRDILEDSKGTMWFATGKGGLSKLVNFEQNIFRTYTIKDGLPSDHILNILQDAQHNFWLATDQGITWFKTAEEKFFNFDTEDGVQKGRFNGNAKLRASDGTMYFGGIEGVNIFRPEKVRINERKPVVVLTAFRIFNHTLKSNQEFNGETYLEKAIAHSKEIRLNYDDNVFSIEFAAMSYISPQSNQYAYKLEGFDQDWTYVDSKKRFATYTNLDPGTYTFRVVASNNDGIWNREGATLTVTVLPPWWKTWWFRVLMLLVLIGAVRLFIYLRTRSIKKRNEFLEEEVKVQTAGLIRSNEEILQKNKILERNNLEISRKTERIMEQQEEILKQKSEVEQLNRTKDKLFSIIAHDLKNPVNALAMLSKRLRKEVKETTDTGKELINHVEISSERIKDLTFNLLEWTKTQIGNIKVSPEKISVHRLIEENIQLYFSQTSQKQITIEENTDPSLYILADYNMVSTIIRNILSNGIKYTSKGGTIAISYYSEEGEVIISFRDNGIGIEGKVLDKLFGEGMNISTKGTDNESGTGLGLMIAREFAELNNGNIYAESKLGEGSTFYLCLPEAVYVEGEATIEEVPVRFREEPQKKLSGQSEVLIDEQFFGKKILLVDDDPQVREAVKLVLNDAFEIYEASDVKYAIELSEKKQPDLIISDVTMPGESGIDFCNFIKQNWVTSHIPVILLTAQSSKGTHLEGLMAGADAYITKPFDRNILLSTVNNLLTFLDNIKLRFSSDIDILPSKYTHNKLDEEVLSKAIRFIEQNISDPELNGDMLCKELGISKTVLYTKLKAITGQTVNEFMRTIRLKKSVDLLIEGRMNITQISIEMGFNSASYYTKSFTAHFGFSPKEYLSRQKAENKLSEPDSYRV